MARWTKNKVNPDDINRGYEYEMKDRPSREQLNAIVNNSFYASEASAEALEKANSAFMANGTVAYVDGVAVPTLSFDSDPQAQISENKQALDSAEKVKQVIYDAFSDDQSINLSKPDGITGGSWGAITFNPEGVKGCLVYAKVGGVVVLRTYIDLTLLKEGRLSSLSTSPVSRNQHNSAGNNAYIFNGVTIQVDKSTETEYALSFSVMFSFNISNNTFTFHNDDTTRYVYRVELSEG